MNEQPDLVPVDDVYLAARIACRAIGGRAWPKAVGARLFPHKDPEDGARYLLNCLDRDRPEKLDPEQLVWLAREGKRAGCHVLMAYLCDAAEYAAPVPVSREDQKDDLQRKFLAAIEQLDDIKRELSRTVAIDRLPVRAKEGA